MITVDELVLKEISKGLQASFEAINELARDLSEPRWKQLFAKTELILRNRARIDGYLNERELEIQHVNQDILDAARLLGVTSKRVSRELASAIRCSEPTLARSMASSTYGAPQRIVWPNRAMEWNTGPQPWD